MTIRDENGWELVSADVEAGRSVWSYFNGQTTTYRTDYRVSNIVSDNREAQAEVRGKRHQDWSRIASVPLNVYYEQLAEASRQGDDKHIARWLNDSDNAAWRVKEGRA